MPLDRYAASDRDGGFVFVAVGQHSGPRRARRAKEMPSNQARALREYREQRPCLILASASPRRADLLRAAGIEFDVTPGRDRRGDEPRRSARRVRPPGRSVEGGSCRPAGAGADHSRGGHDCHRRQRGARKAGGHRRRGADARVALGTYAHRPHRRLPDQPRSRAGASPDQCGAHERRICAAQPRGDRLVRGQRRTRGQGQAPTLFQGLASRFVTRIDGSYSNVVGLPVAMVYNLCKKAGLLIS